MNSNKNSRPSLPNVQLPNVNNTGIPKQSTIGRSISEANGSTSSTINKKPTTSTTSSSLIVCIPPDRRVSIADCAPTRSHITSWNKEQIASGNSGGKRTVSTARRPKSKDKMTDSGHANAQNTWHFGFFDKSDVNHKLNKIRGHSRLITLSDKSRWFERLLVVGIFLCFLFYLNYIQSEIEIIRMQLDQLEKDKSWIKWTIFTFLDKITTVEFFLFLLAAIATRVCMKGLEILQRKVELSQKLKEEELRTSLTIKMKENKLKSKNELWRTFTDGLTKIVGTIVSAVIPSAGVEHIVMKVLDIAEKRQKDGSKYKTKEADEANRETENESAGHEHDKPQTPSTSTNRVLKHRQPIRKPSTSSPTFETQNLFHDRKLGKGINYFSGISGPIIPPESTITVNLPKSQKSLVHSNPTTASHANKFTQNSLGYKPNTDPIMTPTHPIGQTILTFREVSQAKLAMQDLF